MKNLSMFSSLTLLALAASSQLLHAGTHTWTGGGAATNANWSNQANWKEWKPYAGEPQPVGFVFPETGTAYSVLDIPGLTASYINIGKDGLNLTASGPVQLTLADPYEADITTGTNVHATISSPIELVLAQDLVVFDGVYMGNSLDLACKISGSGGLVVDVGGYLTLSGPVGNTYTGATELMVDAQWADDAAWLKLAKTSGLAVPGDLSLDAAWDWYWDEYLQAIVVAAGNNQIAGTATVNVAGVLYMSNTVQTVGPLSVNNGAVWMGNGTLTLNGDLTLNTYEDYNYSYPEASIDGHIDLGTVPAGRSQVRTITSVGVNYLPAIISGNPAVTLKTIGYELHLQGANTYGGPTIVSGGTLYAENATALGTTNNGTTVAIGASLVFTNGMTVAEPLNLSGSGVASNGPLSVPDQYWYGASTFTVSGPVTLNTPILMNLPAKNLIALSGPVSGAGSLTKLGAGELDMTGSANNTFTGGTFVNAGLLGLLKPAYHVCIPGPLTIGDGTYSQSEVDCFTAGQMAANAAVTVNLSCLLQLYADTDVGPLTLHAGNVDTSTAMLRLNGDLTTVAGAGASSIFGKLDLTADRTFNIGAGLGLGADAYIPAVITSGFLAGFTKTGAGSLDISGVNVFSGSALVQQGALSVGNYSALGGSILGTTVASGASLILGNNVWILNESLTLSNNANLYAAAGTNLWGGPITLSSNAYIYVGDSNVVLMASNVISGAGNLIKQGTGRLTLNGNYTNSYSGTTTVAGGILEPSKTNAVAIPGSLVVGDQVNPVNSHAVRLLMPNQIADNAAVTVNASGLLDLSASVYASDIIGSLTGSGNLNLGLNSLYTGGNNASTTFSGAISGWGASSLLKQGTGTMSLNGTSPNFIGTTIINAGTVSINGSQPNSSVSVKSGTTLSGNGTTGYILNTGGKVAPGNSVGMLKSASATLDPFSTFEVELNGTTAGVNYDQLNVTGAVNLNGVILHPILGFNSAVSNHFVLIANDGNDPVSGTFSGLAEGAVFGLGGAQFQITYKGGDGNDVVLTQITPVTPPQFGGINKLPNGQIKLTGTGAAGLTYIVEANADLMTTNRGSTRLFLGSSLMNSRTRASALLSLSERPSRRRHMWLAPDAAHGAGGGYEILFADMVAGFFLPNYFFQPVRKAFVGIAVAEAGAEVVFGDAEEAGADFAVGGQAEAVAMAAERFADGGDDADFAAAIRESPALGSRGWVVRINRLETEAGLEAGQKFMAGDDHFFEPGARGIEGHEFDEAQAQFALASKLGEGFNFMIIDVADDNGVDFDWVEAEFLGQGNAAQDFLQTVASGDLLEIFAVERIETEADTLEAGLAQGAGFLGKQEAVGGHGQIGNAGDRREAADQVFQALPQERFTAGEPDFLDAERNSQANNPLNFFKAQNFRAGHPLLDDGSRIGHRRPASAIKIVGGLCFRKAIEATEIATIGYADPQVAQDAAVGINEEVGRRKRGRRRQDACATLDRQDACATSLHNLTDLCLKAHRWSAAG
jgi:autotransporter-associated beta strand protein